MPQCTEPLVCSLNTHPAVSLFQVSGSLFPLPTSRLCFHSPPSKTWLNSYHSSSGGRNELVRNSETSLVSTSWGLVTLLSIPTALGISLPEHLLQLWTKMNRFYFCFSHTLSTFRPENVLPCPQWSTELFLSLDWNSFWQHLRKETVQ